MCIICDDDYWGLRELRIHDCPLLMTIPTIESLQYHFN